MRRATLFLAIFLVFWSPLLLAEDDPNIELNAKSINLDDDEQILELKNEIEKKSELEKDMIVGSTVVFLNGREDQIRSRESNLGNLITDAILARANADLAFINSRTISTSIDKGLISVRDVKESIPAKDEVIVKKIKGSDLIKTMQHAVSKYPETAGFFPQLSGGRILFAWSLYSENDIVRAEVNSKLIRGEEYYLIATNDSLAAGGDGFEEIKEAEEIENAGRLDEILIDYLQRKEIIDRVEMERIIPLRRVGGNLVYRVEQGDYLYSIAQKFSTTVEGIMQANGIENRNLIYRGQDLIIPGLR
ncbi:MAG: 5'-nucleotidase [Halanaerobium sp.]|nr:MAG: 5'-nucleotidase [Halanaerobium sp.]